MVDFNSGELFTANKGDILNLVILGRRDELINTFQLWREHKNSKSGAFRTHEYKVRACMFSLFLELSEPLERKLNNKKSDAYEKNKEKLEQLKKVINSDDDVMAKDLIEAFRTINEFLDKLNLIKIDTVKKFDSRDVEAENEAKGL